MVVHRGRSVRGVTICFRDLKIEQHIVNDNSNFNVNIGGLITNNNSVTNNVTNNTVAPEAMPDPLTVIEKGQQFNSSLARNEIRTHNL